MSLRSNGRYTRLFSAGVVSNLGDGMSLIAYPWLASAVTRNPLLISLVAVVQRLPWLLFTLPAGVITDRVDRRKAIVLMDGLRGALTVVVALAVLGAQGTLPSPTEVDSSGRSSLGLYLVVLLCTLLLGTAEVLRDNSAQTIVPSIVPADDLEKANGRLWGAETAMNTFVGPPVGSLLLGVAFCAPFLVDAASFFVAAALVASIPGSFKVERPSDATPASWQDDLRVGVRWLWRHELLRSMALILGLMNAAWMISGALLVLYAQEVLGLSPLLYSVMGFGAAVGAIVGGQVASGLSRRVGPGACLALSLGGSAVIAALIGLWAWWPVVMVLMGLTTLLGTLWNVITVSLRQTIIPSHLLGRVNSVYRFFAWGMIPIGAALGGVVVAVVDAVASREIALRATWFVNAAVYAGLFVVGWSKLTTARIEAARADATP